MTLLVLIVLALHKEISGLSGGEVCPALESDDGRFGST